MNHGSSSKTNRLARRVLGVRARGGCASGRWRCSGRQTVHGARARPPRQNGATITARRARSDQERLLEDDQRRDLRAAGHGCARRGRFAARAAWSTRPARRASPRNRWEGYGARCSAPLRRERARSPSPRGRSSPARWRSDRGSRSSGRRDSSTPRAAVPSMRQRSMICPGKYTSSKATGASAATFCQRAYRRDFICSSA